MSEAAAQQTFMDIADNPNDDAITESTWLLSDGYDNKQEWGYINRNGVGEVAEYLSSTKVPGPCNGFFEGELIQAIIRLFIHFAITERVFKGKIHQSFEVRKDNNCPLNVLAATPVKPRLSELVCHHYGDDGGFSIEILEIGELDAKCRGWIQRQTTADGVKWGNLPVLLRAVEYARAICHSKGSNDVCSAGICNHSFKERLGAIVIAEDHDPVYGRQTEVVLKKLGDAAERQLVCLWKSLDDFDESLRGKPLGDRFGHHTMELYIVLHIFDGIEQIQTYDGNKSGCGLVTGRESRRLMQYFSPGSDSMPIETDPGFLGANLYENLEKTVREGSAGLRAKSENNMSFATVIIFTDKLNRAIGVEYFGNPNEGTSRVKTQAANLWETSAHEYLEDVAGLYR
ncbi:hypothetical protein B0H13DRAFT_1878497 [Mycena leptocephala]|nr:hypothetical protein B0H13DRAFT_1878497 [Mycena leptocephala]